MLRNKLAREYDEVFFIKHPLHSSLACIRVNIDSLGYLNEVRQILPSTLKHHSFWLSSILTKNIRNSYSCRIVSMQWYFTWDFPDVLWTFPISSRLQVLSRIIYDLYVEKFGNISQGLKYLVTFRMKYIVLCLITHLHPARVSCHTFWIFVRISRIFWWRKKMTRCN